MENVCNNTEAFRSKIYYEVPFENLNQEISRITRKDALVIEKNGNSDMVIPLLNSYFDGCSYLIPQIIGKIGKNKRWIIVSCLKINPLMNSYQSVIFHKIRR